MWQQLISLVLPLILKLSKVPDPLIQPITQGAIDAEGIAVDTTSKLKGGEQKKQVVLSLVGDAIDGLNKKLLPHQQVDPAATSNSVSNAIDDAIAIVNTAKALSAANVGKTTPAAS